MLSTPFLIGFLLIGQGTADDGVKEPDTKINVFVIELKVTEELAERYPEFKEHRVGFGLCHRIVDSIWEVPQFVLLEEKNEVFERILDGFERRRFVKDAEADVFARYEFPEYFIYAEVFDFAITEHEKLRDLGVRRTTEVRIGIQLRLNHLETGIFIPASAVGVEKAKSESPWGSEDSDFDESLVGKASRDAIESALATLLERWKKRGVKP